MLQLQDSEADLCMSNCNIGVVGTANYDTIKSLTSTKSSHSNISYTSEHIALQQHNTVGASEDDDMLLKTFQKRKDAESQVRKMSMSFMSGLRSFWYLELTILNFECIHSWLKSSLHAA